MLQLKKEYRDLEMKIRRTLRELVETSKEQCIKIYRYGIEEKIVVINDNITFVKCGYSYSFDQYDLEDVIDIIEKEQEERGEGEKKCVTIDLKTFFEINDFNVHLFEQEGNQCAELELWTEGGINMIVTLMPFCKESFYEYVESFSIDEECDVHRQDSLFRKNFTVSQTVKEFTDYQKKLKEVESKLRKL